MSRADLFDEAADDCAEFAAIEKANWEHYRPYRYEEPAARAVKLREFATLVRELDTTWEEYGVGKPRPPMSEQLATLVRLQSAERAVIAWLLREEK